VNSGKKKTSRDSKSWGWVGKFRGRPRKKGKNGETKARPGGGLVKKTKREKKSAHRKKQEAGGKARVVPAQLGGETAGFGVRRE